MTELMRLYSTYLGPSSDTLLDLGATTFRWNNMYLFGTMSSPIISNSSTNTAVLTATSASIVGLSNNGATINSAYIVGLSNNGATVNSATVTVLTVTSSMTTSGRFTRFVGSSLTLSNSANAYLNVNMLTHNAAGLASGDVWFFASSNRLYLAARSQNATYYMAMDT